MSISVTKAKGRIRKAINAFGDDSHSDYFCVRKHAKTYLSSTSTINVVDLASYLDKTLKKWGAGIRRAPKCKSEKCISTALRDVSLHSNLLKLAKCSKKLRIVKGRRALTPSSPFQNLAQFDVCLIETLHDLSDKLFSFKGEPNVTYPMKALLLLTGLMPAFDTNVKKGLKNAGVAGVNKSQYLMPQVGHDDAKKICALPFYIADCVSQFSKIINSEVRASGYPGLAGENGRIFDILLFVQGKEEPARPIISFSPRKDLSWYKI